MSSVLILGPSGSGKSSGIRTLDAESTFIIGVIPKPLPFRGGSKKYTAITGWNDTQGHYFASDEWQKVIKCIRMVNDNRPEITTIVLDDFNYLMANEFMRRACEKGYERFSEIARNAWLVINELSKLRDDLHSIVICHNDIDASGVSRPKTIGKMLDDKVCIEGMFSTVLHSVVLDGAYKFRTQNEGRCVSKSPMGCFDEPLIDNDLRYVVETIKNYNEGE